MNHYTSIDIPTFSLTFRQSLSNSPTFQGFPVGWLPCHCSRERDRYRFLCTTDDHAILQSLWNTITAITLTLSSPSSHGTQSPAKGQHWLSISPTYHSKWPPIVYVKVKCHFTAETVRVWNSSSSFRDIILNILNFLQLKSVCFAMRRLIR